MISDAPLKLKVFSKVWIRSKLTFPFSDIILSNSYAGLKSYNVPNKRSYCIHNGFDFSRLDRLEDKKKVREKFDVVTEKVVGMVGAFADRKDYKTYLFAAMKILSKRNDVSFMAVGEGKNLEDCKKLVKKENKNKIIFTGKQNDVESIVNIFDIGILACNTNGHAEGISNSIMEYMALGKPVIATDCRGTRELVIHNKTGYLIKNQDIKGLIYYINLLLRDKTLSDEMGKNGYYRIKSKFSYYKMINQYVKMYYNVIGYY